MAGPGQRALLAALLLRAGHVVPTEQLVDELYGAEPPKTATASLQNSVAALRKAARAGDPRHARTRISPRRLPEQIDARRFELLLADARDCSPAERRTLLLRGLALWRGPPLAEFAFEAWAETEARRLDDLRLVAVEERIAADIELDRAADVVPELDALAREHPLRERVCELHMLALYRAGRQADALEAYATIRKALARARSRAGRKAQGAPVQDPPARPGALPETERGRAADADVEIAKAILSGRLVPVLGLDGAADLAAGLASVFGYPSERPLDLARVSQYVATMNGSGPLYDELHARFEAAIEPQPVHRFLARLAPIVRQHGAMHPLIVSGRYDLAIERAFEEAGEELDVVTYVAAGPESREVLAPAAERGAASDRRAEHVRHRVDARAAHGAAQAARRGRSVPGARVGELRDHGGRLHRLPRALGRRGGGSRRAGRAAPAQPFPLPRVTRWSTGT